MNAKPLILAGPILGAVLAASAPVEALTATNAIRGIGVEERGAAVELDIQGSRAPSYTVFKLQDPPRLVVDLAGADVSQVSSPLAVGKAGVLSVSTAQYKDDKSVVGRVIVSLDPAARYEVSPRGDSVVVKVQKGEATAGSAPSPPLGERGKVAAVPTSGSISGPSSTAISTKTADAPPTAAPTATPSRTATPAPKVAATAPVASPAPPEGGDHVVSRRMDAAKVKHRARAVTAVRTRGTVIGLEADGQIARFEVIELRDPSRLALDLYGVERAPRGAVPGVGGFRQVRFGRDAGKVRVVLDADGALPRYQVKRTARGLAVISTAVVSSANPSPTSRAEERGRVERISIRDVRFTQSGGLARIEIAGRAPHAITRPDARTLVLTLEGAELPKRLERSLDTDAFRGPVTMVSSFNQPSTGQVRIVATLRGEVNDKLAETPAGLAWTVAAGAAPRRDAQDPVVVADARATAAESRAAGFAAEAPRYATSGAPQRKEYTGRRITLDFHDIDIRNLLRLIADVSRKNIVVADDVTGKVTVSLRNVPWDQALDLILKTKGLDKEEVGNVIRVAKFEQIAKEAEERAKAAAARKPLEPLKVRLIPVNFARASEVSGRVKDVLTDRGSVSTDDRTNVLIVKDVQEALVRAEGLVRNLDTETPQVLIESRIVEASSNFSQQIGVQWGGNATLAQTFGNPVPVPFPNIVGATGGAGGGPTQGTAGTPNYAVNLPAPIGQGAGGGIGFVFGSASGAFNLNLRLSALENRGIVKTISAPKIATIDNKEATIGQGLSIPFSQVSAAGVNTTFIEAKLELKVTPHVTADGSILLKIKATNNQPNPQLTGANGQPSISKREAETEVLVKDGDTTVIGGIYTRTTSTRINEVPYFSKIPILGFFFRSNADQDDHTELLIFITPRIVNRQQATVAAGG